MATVHGRRSGRIARTLALLCALVALRACDNFDFYARLDGDGEPPPDGELAVSPVDAVLPPGATLQFTASGGDPPYLFLVVSGVGAIDPATGLYTAPDGPGSAIIEVSDSADAAVQAQVFIFE